MCCKCYIIIFQINEVLTDIVIEQIIEDDIIIQEVNEEAPEVAQEVLSQYDSKIERREMKEVYLFITKIRAYKLFLFVLAHSSVLQILWV